MAIALQRLIRDDGARGALAERAGVRTRQLTLERMADDYLRAYGDGLVQDRMTQMTNRPTIAFFGSSLVSAYGNGAATYYRGMVRFGARCERPDA